MHNRHEKALNGGARVNTLDLKRFAKVCEQLDSPHPKEREVAGAKASAMLAAADLTWDDIIFGGTSEPAPRMADMYGIKACALIRLIAGKRKNLPTEWDREFIRCLAKQGKRVTLTRKQWASLMVIAVKSGAIMDLATVMGVSAEGSA
jgi:hypothetical protein